ncbi:bifunctional DNA primase/polymerase [Pseudolysinimonas sp.]|jgi:hypothetical protein|uniref:bifunctional DNA primase/polymerase n=1 Tax=Pseudolysinimonas sp. TaxID=2680009 RepID=UPI003783A23A
MPDLDQALALANAGWEILPLRGKVPLTQHGVKDATTDERTIRGWWSTQAHNVGARVPATLVVLDFDPQNGGTVADLEAATGEPLPETLTVHSGRGTGGQHRYYRRPPGSLSATRLPTGIDVKTDRGYCVMPPSLHPSTGKPYTWASRPPVPLPASVVALLRPVEPPKRAAPAGRTERKALHLAEFVSTRTEGNRNAALFWAACRAAEAGLSSDAFDLLEAAASVVGLTDSEIAKTIASARRRYGATSS